MNHVLTRSSLVSAGLLPRGPIEEMDSVSKLDRILVKTSLVTDDITALVQSSAYHRKAA